MTEVERIEAGTVPDTSPPDPNLCAPALETVPEPALASEALEERPPGPDRPPFPIEVLPDSIRDLVTYLARVCETDEAASAMPLLTTAMGTIGNAALGEVDAAWQEPLAAFCVVLIRSGDTKTSNLGLLTELAGRVESYLPVSDDGARARLFTSDATAAGVIGLLAGSPRGVLVIRDELCGFFERLASSKGTGAESVWLHCTDGKPFTVDRHQRYGSDHVPRLLASLIGAVQPEVFSDSMRREGRLSSGMAARFWMISPPWRMRTFQRQPKELVDRRGALVERMSQVLTWLRTIPLEGDNPVAICLSLEAEDRLRDFARAQEAVRACLPECSVERAMRGKCRGWVVRVATTIALVRHAERQVALTDPASAAPMPTVELADIEAGVAVIEWQIVENRRVLHENQLDGRELELLRLEELVAQAMHRNDSGTLTVRLLARRHGLNAEAASLVFDKLVASGRWESFYPPAGPEGGRPSRHYRRVQRKGAST